MAKASNWSWVTKSAVAPAALRMPRTSCASRSRRSTSRFENGSSSSMRAGPGRQRARQRHPLLLPAGKLVRIARRAALEPHEAQHLVHPGRLFRLRQAVDAEGHVAAHGQVGKRA